VFAHCKREQQQGYRSTSTVYGDTRGPKGRMVTLEEFESVWREKGWGCHAGGFVWSEGGALALCHKSKV